jgi:hypothetical protein
MKIKTTCSLLILFLFFCQNISSQSYVDEGNQWSLRSYTFAGPFSSTYRIEGDTTINGIDYKKMLVTSENPNLTVNWNLSKIMREDSTQKVYQLNASNEEKVIYDFGLSVGDTIVSNASPEQNSIVAAIDSIELNDGTKRKRLTITSLYCPDWNIEEYWIEGIGGRNYAFYYVDVFCQTDTGLSLRCFSSNGDFLYGSPDGSQCYIINSIDEIEETAMKIFPNPIQDILYLEYKNEVKISRWEIYNVQGQLILFGQTNNQLAQIDVATIPQGIFFIKMKTDKDQIIQKKFLKIL